MILLRHGQTVFNLHFGRARVDPGVPDPGLTDIGRAQAAAAAQALAGLGIERIIVSPYSRAIETAVIVADRLCRTIEIDADIRERAGYSCDIGREPLELAERWPTFDFNGLSPRWWAYANGDPSLGGLDEPEVLLNDRVFRFRDRIAQTPAWAETLVVCHWGPIRALIGRRVENGEFVRYDPRLPTS